MMPPQIRYLHCSVTALSIPVTLADDHRLEVLALLHLSLDLGDQTLEIGGVLASVNFDSCYQDKIVPPGLAWSIPPLAEVGGSWTTAFS